MRHLLLPVTAALAFLSAPASALTFVEDVAQPLFFNGIVEGVTTPGLTASIQLTFTGFSGNDALFSYTLENTSSAPITGSRVSGFGFNVESAGFTLAGSQALTGPFDQVDSGNVPQLGSRDFCLTGNNCAGGGGAGVLLGDSANGTFSLRFAAPLATLDLRDFYVRYQSIEGSPDGTSGVGVQVRDPFGGVIPEPATWAMMIAGFGLVGAALRRRDGIARASA
jgi:hypothetical protein